MTRRERFDQLVNHHHGNLPSLEGPWDNSAAEDVAEVLRGEVDLRRFCAVTTGGEFTYLYLTETLGEAKQKATANVGDSIYPEGPVEIVDLDTGDTFSPVWASLKWIRWNNTEKEQANDA